MFTKRVKSKPANRSKNVSDEEDAAISASAATETATGSDSPSTLATKLKDRAKKSRPKSRLSFGGAEDEEEGSDDIFQVKKSKLSRKLTLGKSKHSQDIIPNLDQASISPNRGPTYDEAYLNELKASTRRAPPPAADPYDADMSMDIDMSVDVDDVSMQVLDDSFVSASSSIPSESSIKVAKERRERMRTTTASGEDDFISLSLTRKSEDLGPHPESRIMREDDELGEGDDEFAEYTSAQERIALGKKSRKKEAKKRRETMEEMIADAEEQDDETMEWEQEQLRRGGHFASTPPPDAKVKQTYKPAPIPPVTSLPSLGPALDRLAHQLSQLTTSHAAHVSSMNSLAQERTDLDRRETEMREMVTRAEEKRAWFNSFNEWVEGVAGFLDEKYPLLEKLEEEHISLLQERYEMVKKRRTEDDEDDVFLFMGSSSTPAPVEEELDEFGRAKPTLTQLRVHRRAARTARRQQRSRQRDAEEGYSTDDELPLPDAAAYREALDSVDVRKQDVLSDVRAKEFLDPAKGRWTDWRERYADSYVGAWGGLGVVSVWEFWARLECVGWDFVEDSRSLDSFAWYKGLYEYSRPDGEELGSDGDLVSSMITTAIIPRICKIIEGGALDVYSEKHVKRMVDFTEEVEASVEPNNVKIQMLFKSVINLFDQAASLAFNPESIPARRRFLARRVKLLRNLIRWRKHTGERFGVGQSISRLVDGPLLSVAETGWDVGGQEIMKQVSSMIPEELVSSTLRTRLLAT
ncbi:GCFC-domain-containing protein [Hymenopellis radicata]|nr:GCFC-domain-containing protein [Hymenopellis radicata]